MPTEYSPKSVQRQAHAGIRRMKNFRSARLMFIRQYVGQYYDRTSGKIGSESLGLIFNAIRTLIPRLVMQFPKHTVTTDFLAYKEYADNLGLSLTRHDRQIKIDETYRKLLVDACFMLGVMKTGIAQSDSVYGMDETDRIDSGTIYTDTVDFDNLIVDPKSEQHLFADSRFIGDRLCVPRQLLLDSNEYKHDLIERLPGVDDNDKVQRAKELSMRESRNSDAYDSDDYVEIAELWVPAAKAVITIPAGEETTLDDYLRVADYYGPDTGPYTFLALTPPVPGNPIPVASVGIWHDVHVLANEMAEKIVDQAKRQKDVVAYRRSSADDAREARDARDGEAIAMDDPDGVKTISFGGQQNSNEVHLSQLASWFDMLSGNPSLMGGAGGQNIPGAGATGASILAQNSSVGLEDMKGLLYKAAEEEGSKRAWFLHTDPMMSIPLVRRTPKPAVWIQGLAGPVMVEPPQVEEKQIVLTPEMRRGDFLDFSFKIKAESMGHIDSRVRFQQGLDFATKIMPAAMTAAQTAAAIGVAFSVQKYIVRMAETAGMDWLEEVFYDPEFQQQLMMRMMAGPQDAKAGAQGGNSLGAMVQNGQPANLPFNASPETQDRQQQQEGANDSQSMLKQLGV